MTDHELQSKARALLLVGEGTPDAVRNAAVLAARFPAWLREEERAALEGHLGALPEPKRRALDARIQDGGLYLTRG